MKVKEEISDPTKPWLPGGLDVLGFCGDDNAVPRKSSQSTSMYQIQFSGLPSEHLFGRCYASFFDDFPLIAAAIGRY